MYSRISKAKQQKRKHIIISLLSIIVSIATVTVIIPQLTLSTTKAEVIKTTSQKPSSPSQVEKKVTSASTTGPSLTEETTANLQDNPDEIVIEPEESTSSYNESYSTEADLSYTETTSANNYTTQTSTTLSNGNAAGSLGRDAAAQMAAATGVSQATWEAIIARESNGDPTVSNSTGASGLFQTMPGWGSTANVQDQITSAINAYNSQGLSAWGY